MPQESLSPSKQPLPKGSSVMSRKRDHFRLNRSQEAKHVFHVLGWTRDPVPVCLALTCLRVADPTDATRELQLRRLFPQIHLPESQTSKASDNFRPTATLEWNFVSRSSGAWTSGSSHPLRHFFRSCSIAPNRGSKASIIAAAVANSLLPTVMVSAGLPNNRLASQMVRRAVRKWFTL